MVLDLQPLRAEAGNRHDPRAECGRPRRLRGALGPALSLLQEPGIDAFLRQTLVDLTGPSALQDHPGNPGDAVPDGKIRDRGAAGQREQILSLQNAAEMGGKHLLDRHVGVAVIDADIGGHALEREDGRVGTRPAGWDQDSDVAGQRDRRNERGHHDQPVQASHEPKRFALIRTTPLSVPTYRVSPSKASAVTLRDGSPSSNACHRPDWRS